MSGKHCLIAILPGLLNFALLSATAGTGSDAAEDKNMKRCMVIARQMVELLPSGQEQLFAQRGIDRVFGYARESESDALATFLERPRVIEFNLANLRDKEGKTLLHVAVEAGRVYNIRVLLTSGASVNTPDAAGITPFMAFLKGTQQVTDTGTFYAFMKRKAVIDFEAVRKDGYLLVRLATLLKDLSDHRLLVKLDQETKGLLLKQCERFKGILLSECAKLEQRLLVEDRTFLVKLCKDINAMVIELKKALPMKSKL